MITMWSGQGVRRGARRVCPSGARASQSVGRGAAGYPRAGRTLRPGKAALLELVLEGHPDDLGGVVPPVLVDELLVDVEELPRQGLREVVLQRRVDVS